MADMQQPDFGQMAQNFRSAADQIERCRNAPAFDNGASLMQRLDQLCHLFATLESRLTTMENRLNAGFATMENRFVTLENRVNDVGQRVDDVGRKVMLTNQNGVLRTMNREVTLASTELEPMVSLITGQEIENFPQTIDDVDGMSGKQAPSMIF
ncbi:hypothetical protein E4U55_008001 [Claviceps digitariae]|nr:hypothetical protein E4U55_008001 [Claviceps digitariae]